MKVLDETPTPTDRPVPLDREWAADRELDVFGSLMFLWQRRVILLIGLLAGGALGFVTTIRSQSEYTATATVLVRTVPPETPPPPHVLNIDSVDLLARSASVRDQVVAELSRRQLIPAGGGVRDFRTVVYSSSDPKRPTLSMLALTLVATSPALARDGANLWADTVSRATANIEASRRDDAVEFVAKEYPKAAERLAAQERALEGVRREHLQALRNARARAGVSLREAQVSSAERSLVDLGEERQRLALNLIEIQAGIAALEQELKQVDPLKSNAQESNPVYAALTEKLADARVRLRETTARQTAVEAQLEQLRRTAETARAALSASELAIANLELQQETEVLAKERDVTAARSAYFKLEDRLGDAQYIAAIKDSTLKPGTPAELPSSPSGPSTGRRVALGAVAGLGLVLLVGWFLATARERGVRLT